jgi:hypothetical protein
VQCCCLSVCGDHRVPWSMRNNRSLALSGFLTVHSFLFTLCVARLCRALKVTQATIDVLREAGHQ